MSLAEEKWPLDKSGRQVPPPAKLLRNSRKLRMLAFFSIAFIGFAIVPIIWNVDNFNNILLFFDIPQIFLLIFAFVLANNYTRSPGWTTGFIVLAIFALLLTLAGWIWRIVRVVQCENGKLDSDPDCGDYFSQDIYTIVIEFGLVVIDVLYIAYGVWHRREMTAYLARLNMYSYETSNPTTGAIMVQTSQQQQAPVGTPGYAVTSTNGGGGMAYGAYGGNDTSGEKGVVPPYTTPITQGPPLALPPASSRVLTTPAGARFVHGAPQERLNF